jgi:hypothetical protein
MAPRLPPSWARDDAIAYVNFSSHFMSFLARRLATRAIAARRFPPTSRTYVSQTEQPDYDLDNYPKLPNVSHQTRPALGWDDMLERRNIGEPVSHHIHY